MCASSPPLNGADSEPLSQYDRSCDACLKTMYAETLHQTDGKLLCDACYLPRTLAGRALLVWVGLQKRELDADMVAALIRAAEKEAAA